MAAPVIHTYRAAETGLYVNSYLTAALQAFLPGAPLTWMIELGADAVAAELTAAELTAADTIVA